MFRDDYRTRYPVSENKVTEDKILRVTKTDNWTYE